MPGRGARRRRPLRGAPGREGRHRRRRSRTGTSAVDVAHAHRRVGAGRGRAGRRASRARRSTPAGASSCAATRVGADTALARRSRRLVEDAQTGKAPVQRLADRVSGRLRAGRHRARASRRSASGSAPAPGRDVRVHRRRRGADHRLPVRARPGDADGADGRHRPRRAARPADQGPGGPRVHAPRRHRSCSTRPAP